MRGTSILLFFSFLFSISCSSNEKAVQCGCQGDGMANVSADKGIIVKVVDGNLNGYHFLSLKYGYFDFCTDVPAELQVDGLQVKISGTLKVPCATSKSPVLEVQHYPFSLSSYLISSDSLFVGTPIAIGIFPYQSPVSSGFGYSINAASGLKILQETIPVIGGNQTFSTPTKAFKIAVLVGHKILLDSKDLPTLVYSDLEYLDALN